MNCMHACARTALVIVMVGGACLTPAVWAAADTLENVRYVIDETSIVRIDTDVRPPHDQAKYRVYFVTDGPLESLLYSPTPLSMAVDSLFRDDPDVKQRLSKTQCSLMRYNWIADNSYARGEDASRHHGAPLHLFPSLAEWNPPEDYTGPRPRVHSFEAASEEDARILVTKIITAANDKARDRYASAVRELEETRSYLVKAEARLVQAEADVVLYTARIEEMRATLGYDEADLVQEEIVEIWRALRRVDVDVAGATARGEAIDKRLAKGPPDPALVLMRTEIDIEMAGHLGRAATLRQQLDLLQAFAGVPGALTKAKDTRSRTQLELEGHRGSGGLRQRPAELQAQLDNPPQAWRPVKLLDDTIALRPIQIVHVEGQSGSK